VAKKLPRRTFLQTLGSAAVVSALPNIVKAQATRRVAVFREAEGPWRHKFDFSLSGPLTFLTEQELIARLNARDFDLFVNPYGSAFPRRAWDVILKYLQDGGNWLNLGGAPLAVPVRSTGSGGWPQLPYQPIFHKRLGITHVFPVKTDKVVKYQSAHEELTRNFSAEGVFELYVRLSSSSNEPDEAGSDGPHEGVVEPLMLGLNSEGRAIVAPVIQIDRHQGEFKGGRWVFGTFSGSMTANAVRFLIERASQGAVRFRVRSNFACYRVGEVPSVSVEGARGDYSVEVRDPAGQVVATDLTRIPRTDKPGLYQIHGRSGEYVHSNGFWVYDEELLKRGKPLTVDNHFFYRDGKVLPVTGTTYMASDVHRRFLFEPNPFVWDRDFRQMKEAGVNMVRTGIWTGWKKYMPEPGKVNEGVLRAFDAFLLTAHKYDIPVIFTFFAFLPETWGGLNAYLDPKAVKAQQQFISAFAKRCQGIDDVIWDFINEPSFCSPKFLWNCRPNYDEFETAAWKQWVRDHYRAPNDAELVAYLQHAWQTTRDDVLELPKLQDFESVNLIDERQPLKTLDYRLFAQEMFIRWTKQMTTAVRSNGNPKQLITVGQDEAGLGDSPNIQFFAPHVDFTSLHNWWANDDLVWDSVLAKVPTKASLMEETGVMFYENAEGQMPWRSEEEVSNLLERKLALSFAADGAGFIEWIWNTNPYMNSTNEVGIGFHRVDGTAKPELEPFLAIAKFMAQHGQRLRDRQAEPVVMLIPHMHMFSPRSFVYEATRRCVRAMYYHCGVPMQAISEYTLADHAYPAKLIVVPAPRVLTEKCWDALKARMDQGTTVAISGLVLNAAGDALPVAQTESVVINGRNYLVRFEGEKIQRIEKTTISNDHRLERLIRNPLPLELGDSMEALVAFYRFAMMQAGVAPIFTATPRTPAVLVLPSVFRDVVLYTFVSETNRDTTMQVTDLQTKARFPVTVPAGRTAMVMIDRRTGRQIT